MNYKKVIPAELQPLDKGLSTFEERTSEDKKATEIQIKNLTDSWNSFTNLALGSSPIDGERFRLIARDTFKLLSDLDNEETFSKSITKLLMTITEFSAYAFSSSDELGKDPLMLYRVALELSCQFVEGYKNCDSAYPMLHLRNERAYINLDNDDLLNFIFPDIELPF